MRLSIVVLSFHVLGLMLSGCASPNYYFSSNPADASVYYYDPVTQKQFLMGKTPLKYNKGALPSEKAFIVSFEKDGFVSKEVPIAPTDEKRTVLSVKLRMDPSADGKKDSEVNAVVGNLFKAQNFIYRKQYQAAIIELEKVIKGYPNVSQAYVMKGTAYYLLDELDSAMIAWQKAMKIDPENPELNRFLQEKNIVLNQ